MKDQVILVTGASQGIGRAIAAELLAQGAIVGLQYNKTEDGISELLDNYPKAVGFASDLSSTAGCIKLFNAVKEHFGTLNTLVLNAGVFIPHSVALDLEAWMKVWDQTIAVNLTAPAVLTKLGISHFKQHGGGRFIYMGSRAAFRGETDEYLAYAASKGGLTSLARSVARSFGKDNIKAFTIAPGFTMTRMADSFITKHGKEKVVSELALNDLTEPEDIAPLVAFICSGKMDHATGTTIDINAGSYMH